MSKTVWMFPGQGAQKAGMAKDFYENSPLAKELFDQADAALDFDLRATCFEENEQLHLTEYTQPCLVAACLAIAGELRKRGQKPDMTAGLSLGEYAAIAAAGGMTALDAIRLVRKRGLLMQNTVPAGEGAMCAVLGMETGAIEAVLENRTGVTIANYNCPGQIVITGKTAEVQEAAEALKAAGARRVVPLKVSGPFHSPLLKSAGEKLSEALAAVEMQNPEVPYYANVTAAKVTEKAEIRPLLARGVSSPVRWQQSVEAMIGDGADTFVEIGPGKTLAGFMKKINPDVKVYNIASWEDMEQFLREHS
ncbi:ACP S-malonyltransferase [Anaerosacchariphilus sp. NSJ-68]|uniref:Malonyl CoA-acyl carrier protein transacylase n=2 Tax=Lachnospiraceae TaxID=186803 RepID=A0A923RM60_9FIRM|nr:MULTISPECIES: ACP S-malonyltransferase [Lachnospiraceae]MBC5659081.1 ACP S-malonyltransferase [Anaerosacchariphilus hominis]MBC5698649.1 ACP S-malonyltransferase [Roseburia difficilis]